MAIQVEVDEKRIDNFSGEAQITLKKQVEKYASDIIKEANLIEEHSREEGASTEITSNTVLLAVRKKKMNHTQKSHFGLIITKIISSLSLLVTGFLFDPSGYQDNVGQLIAFVILLVIASVSTVLQFVLEEKE